MPLRDDVLKIAAQEVGVGVLTNPQRVAQYFASYPKYADKSEQGMLQVSWCQLFINWVLLNAGYPMFDRSYSSWINNAKDQKDDGFQYLYKPKATGYKPKPGDIYYSPIVGNKKTEHMGFIVKDHGNGRYQTVDGNTGGPGHALYSETLWSGKSSGSLIGGIGGGVVCFNERIDNGGANVGIVGFIPLPLMIYTRNPYVANR